MDKEEVIRLRWRAITGNLTEEDLNKLNSLNIKIIPLENAQETKLNDNNTSTNSSTSKQLVKSNGKSLLEKDNNTNNYGMSNIIFLATISFVSEIGFLIISMFLFK